MNKNLLLILIASLLFTGCERMLFGPGPENTPAGNFDVLWKTIDEKYGQFPVKDVNWDSLYNVFSIQITPPLLKMNYGRSPRSFWLP